MVILSLNGQAGIDRKDKLIKRLLIICAYEFHKEN